MTAAIHTLSLLDGLQAIAKGKLTPREWSQACLERIAERDETVHAWAHINPSQTLAAAEHLTSGPLFGAPIAVKDLIDTADMPTGYGSQIYARHQPLWDAPCVTTLRNNGAIILGKTVSTEFAYFGPGPTTNPHDQTRTPGGSSSGSAAAVADFQAPAALGTQTAGSVIRPAAFCGIVGYKPTYGLLPLSGIRPLAPSMDHLGVLTRTVDDAAFLASVIGRRPSLALKNQNKYIPTLGFCRTHDWEHADETTRAKLTEAIETFAKCGAKVIDVELPDLFSDLGEAQNTLMDFEVSVTGQYEYTHHKNKLSAQFQDKVASGLCVTAEQRDTANTMRTKGLASLNQAMCNVDVLICPSTVGEAPQGLESTGDPIFNRIWTFLGVPCVNVPGLTGPNAMPIGLQVVGKAHDDARTLAAAQWAHQNLS